MAVRSVWRARILAVRQSVAHPLRRLPPRLAERAGVEMTDARFEELLLAFERSTCGHVEEQVAARAAIVAYFEERTATVMERLDVMRDELKNGMQENEDGTYTVIWTKRQLETAKKEAKKLYDKLWAEPDEAPR